MKPFYQKTGFILSGVLIFLAILGIGCLGFSQQPAQPDITSVKCPVSLESGQNMIINVTQNNATICTSRNSTLTIQRTDFSRVGGEWILTSTPELQITDEGGVWYDDLGVPTGIPGFGKGIHTWNVTMNGAGVQRIKAVLEIHGREITSSDQALDLTIIVK